MSFVLAFVVAILATSGCATESDSVVGPSPAISYTNELGSGSVSVLDENNNLVLGHVRFGNKIVMNFIGISCEKSTSLYGNQYVRDDGEILRPSSGYPCTFVGHGGTAQPTDTLESRNNIWEWGRGHRVTLEFVIMEIYPVPVYRKVIGNLVFGD